MSFLKKLKKEVEEPGNKAGAVQSKNTLGTEEDSPPQEEAKRSAIFRKLKEIGYKTGEIKIVFGKRKSASAKVREEKQKK